MAELLKAAGVQSGDEVAIQAFTCVAVPEAVLSVGARPLFVAAILAGSFLLFLVQPMVARMALPRLGGAPTCGAIGTPNLSLG